MNQEIINKLNLKETGITFGRSFINNIKVYLWPNCLRGYKVYAMCCNLEGEPIEEGFINFLIYRIENGKKLSWQIKVSDEIVLSQEREMFARIITTIN